MPSDTMATFCTLFSTRLRMAALLALAGLGLAVQAASVRILVQDAQGAALRDAAVLLEPTGATRVLPVKPLPGVEIVQRDKAFEPEVSVVPVGTAVAFPNQDTVRHHVYSFSEAKRFELKLYIGRPANPVVFDKPGVVILGCNIHDHMVGWVIVANTPWYGKSGAEGAVAWSEVPPGSYRLRVWHPDLPIGSPGLERPLQVGESALSSTVKLTVPPP